ncbi:hypothetical protein [Granulicella tundricola]|uniref:hypothetical protein n=1 Tax=Granulicella tundricola TaxID=940615 RepID=UPI001E2DBF8E|nr:hypothetical protein [Granulicella tundricola]
MPKSSARVLIAGLILGSVPGLYPSRLHLLADTSLLVGVLLIVFASLRGGLNQPKRALILIGYCNLAFWLSYVVWMLRLKMVGPSLDIGIDPFAGVLAEWFVLLVLGSAYEVIVFTRGIFSQQQRRIALVGMGVLLIQILTSIQVSYRLLQGV